MYAADSDKQFTCKAKTISRQ